MDKQCTGMFSNDEPTEREGPPNASKRVDEKKQTNESKEKQKFKRADTTDTIELRPDSALLDSWSGSRRTSLTQETMQGKRKLNLELCYNQRGYVVGAV